MCQFFSFIVTEGKLLYDLENHSHSHILEKYNIKDEDDSPEFVRVELVPKKNIASTNKEDYEFIVDQDFKPEWFNAEIEFDACFDLYQKLLKKDLKALQISCVKQNGYAIRYIDNPCKDAQLEAVKQNGCAIYYIKNPCEDVQREANKNK